MFVFGIDGGDYVYLLGMYLGDGSVSSASNQLVITLDAKYPGIIVDCAETMERIAPNKVSIRKQNIGECFQVYSGWHRWPLLLPQHGPGRKHTRPIVLTPWQWELVRRHR